MPCDIIAGMTANFIHYLSLAPQILLVLGAILLITAVTIGIMALYTLRQNAALKYEFITIIAHKFRTPLSHIKYLSQMFVENEKDSLQLENMKELQKSNEQLISMTGTLIELAESKKSTESSYVFESVPLCKTTKSLADSIRISFQEKNISFSVTCPEDEISVLSDRTRLEFVLQTIFENAYTYTPSGGRVDVAVGSSHRKASVSVTDNGIGIHPRDIHNIFLKFYRTKNAQSFDTEGLGVSLYMAKKIMRRLHGNIRAFSAGENKGSTFEATLPLS